MKEFEKALREARPPESRAEEFRQALRRDLLTEERRLRRRRATVATGGLAAVAAVLASVLVLFVLRPSVPQRLHAALVESPAVPAAEGSGGGTSVAAGFPLEEPGRLLRRTGATASADRVWLDGLYERQPEASRVQSLEEERLFALRRFRLTSGRSIVVLTEIGGDPLEEPATQLSTIQEF